jgi:glutathione synthase/RimK-type ligase-like ATP-grasp enzyme
MESLEGYVRCDDDLAYRPLQVLGWHVEAVPWCRPDVDWGRFDAVVIRSTWDYYQAVEAFVAVLERITQSGANLQNPLDLVRWNIKKTYLRDLQERGVRIVPTAWGADIGSIDERAILEELGTEEVVVKPLVGASAAFTYRLQRGSEKWSEAAAALEHREYLAQPFIPSIISEGEYSLFFFSGTYSHAIVKTPGQQDFRVQEEHGGVFRTITAMRELVQEGEQALAAIGQVPLYARVDFVRLEDGGFGLMELELVEPALYLGMDEEAPERFACALDHHIRKEAPNSIMGNFGTTW